MIDNPFTMVVIIVLIVTIGRVMRSRGGGYLGGRRSRNNRIDSQEMANDYQQRMIGNGETERLQEEVRTLKERIQVLERIAMDNNSANDLNREIEKLRNS